MPRGKKNTGKGKEKAVPNLKRPASTHDLRNESTTADGDSTCPDASSQFSAVIKFSSGAAAVNSCSAEIPATTGTVRELEPPAEGPMMIPVTSRKQVRSSLTRIRMEAGESSKRLENNLSRFGIGSQKGGHSTPGMPGIPETLGTPDLPRTPGTPGTPGTPQLLRTPTVFTYPV
ncbi:hypothetical protein L211DRAFT_847236 [Terfezia boudieri ATCC MYA-4762]|uniref:Uncharacterized protein n=1 Tax=Terfezia boudieri ATCC MYA-4762 TaxID=1051890 RepID=A0A3N4LYE9_9PEZI|nr:hypothetical protein L211DRAFT_847236 [Terfezia boudieri ATCC MYA-4762]